MAVKKKQDKKRNPPIKYVLFSDAKLVDETDIAEKHYFGENNNGKSIVSWIPKSCIRRLGVPIGIKVREFMVKRKELI